MPCAEVNRPKCAYLEALLPFYGACLIIFGGRAANVLVWHCCLDEEILLPTQQHPVHSPAGA